MAMILYAKVAGAKCWTALTVVACGGVLLNNSIYFSGEGTPRFLLEKGAIDMIVDRRDMRDRVSRLIALLKREPAPEA